MPRVPQGTDPRSFLETDKLARFGESAIKKALAKRQLELKDLKTTLQNIDRLRAKSDAFRNDPTAILASTGADIYFQFDCSILPSGRFKKGVVTISVMEAVTALQLGSSTGRSQEMMTEDEGALIEMAVDNCIEEVIAQVQDYWRLVPTKGKPITVLISSKNKSLNEQANGKSINRHIKDIFKQNAVSYRLDNGTEMSELLSPVYVNVEKYNDVTDFRDLLEDLFTKLGLNVKVTSEGKSIELEIQ